MSPGKDQDLILARTETFWTERQKPTKSMIHQSSEDVIWRFHLQNEVCGGWVGVSPAELVTVSSLQWFLNKDFVCMYLPQHKCRGGGGGGLGTGGMTTPGIGKYIMLQLFGFTMPHTQKLLSPSLLNSIAGFSVLYCSIEEWQKWRKRHSEIRSANDSYHTSREKDM